MSWFHVSPIGALRIPREFSEFYKTAQKKMTFSSMAAKTVIERRAEDISELSNTTPSKVMEEALVNQLLPTDERAASYVNAVLLGKKYDLGGNGWVAYGVKNALADIFAEASMGTNWAPKRNNCEELAKFADRLIAEHGPKFKGSYASFDFYYELLSNFESTIAILEKSASRSGAPDHAAQAAIAKKSLLPAIQQGEAKPRLISRFIVANWDYIKCSTFALRTMASLLEACTDWMDTAANRNEFQQLCELVLPEWTVEDLEKRKKEETRNRATNNLVRYPISDGDYVLAPADWIEINPTDAPSATHAGVMSIRFGERYDAPTFLFYTQCEHRNLTESDRKHFERLAESRWPMLERVKQDEVGIKRNPDGGIANAAEVAAAPAIGMFPLYDEGKYPLGGEPPYGAKIIRHVSECAESEVNQP